MMNSPPDWVLSIIYGLHMIAAVVGIGGISFLWIVTSPTFTRYLKGDSPSKLHRDYNRRVGAIGWFSLVILFLTGLFQMSAHPNYSGFLAINDRWSLTILMKHAAIFLIIIVSGYLQWVIIPKTQRFILNQRVVDRQQRVSRMLRKERGYQFIIMAMSLIIIILTAIARIS
jgi:uncharacterized membrane protein